MATSTAPAGSLAEATRRQRARDGAATRRLLAPFAGQRLTLRTQAELDRYEAWARPPRLAGAGHFRLGPEHGAGEVLIEVVDETTLDIEQVRGCIVARSEAVVSAAGPDLTVLAFDRSHAEARDEATVYAFDEARVAAANAIVHAYGQSRVEAFRFSDVAAYDQAEVTAHGSSLVYLAEQAGATIGSADGLDPLAQAMGIPHEPAVMRVFATGPGRVTVGAASSPCVLVVSDDRTTLDATAASEAWWRETLELTAATLVTNPVWHSQALEWLRERSPFASR
jgi:hypothetical protein